MNEKYYLEYPIEKKRFSKTDLKIVEILKEAGKKVGEIFAKQADGDFKGGGFYPTDATRKEIEEASKKEPKILDPYTVVKRDSSGKLCAVYYHEEYRDVLKEISDLFLKASKLASEKSFKKYLEIASKEFCHGDYSTLEKAWIAVDNKSFLHLMAGPLGSYADRLFSLKKAYNFNFTYTGTNGSYNPLNYVDVIRNMLPPFGSKARQNVSADMIKVRVDNVICIGGRNASLPARAVNYPEDINTIKKCGIKIVVYTNNIERRDGQMLLPLFRDFIELGVQKSFSDDFIMANAVRLVLAHEITEAIFQYEGAWKRLKSMSNPVMELHSSIVGIKACGFQVIKGVLSQKDLEAILYVMLMRTFSDYFIRKTAPQVENYLVGYRVFYNYCLENGAIKLDGDRILPNASKMYSCADQLANVVMHFYAEASEAEVQSFFDKYSSEYMYGYFSDKLLKYEF
ncbi:hypothetical protein A2716_03850 [candidate division WWE3 bacterium RIFCSPHIGHO2_01_FULL_40_23]|uniref:Uncharacterized protein n=1 Tax=candidate division WWE3 bacterium RIFCSPLOWO2_01_FULL_41_18 TaxID=1802625 RepID=A0A1F4VE90_UNCKA|nr:MAG: hypothetical protein A2716_03850 [candidate division WWE3 bacterium RIFCSPHIGHO2_01_FULL_40_23]OGC55013.1 MAG: hypothetical protein A3A78_03460 [candidate division WWE3 bacterium RIFCSPLOWO2_01_FULL_41_18]